MKETFKSATAFLDSKGHIQYVFSEVVGWQVRTNKGLVQEDDPRIIYPPIPATQEVNNTEEGFLSKLRHLMHI